MHWHCLLTPCAPQNTRYVVASGARQKDEDWDPEENGGYAVHGEVSFDIVGTSPIQPV